MRNKLLLIGAVIVAAIGTATGAASSSAAAAASGPCGTAASAGAYQHVIWIWMENRHNPAVYYTSLSGCSSRDVPYTRLAADLAANALPAFSFITPNLIDDMHDGTIAQGDAWLARSLPAILGSREYRSGTTAIFVTWDEGSGGYPVEDCDDNSSTDASCRVPTIVISPVTPAGVRAGAFFDHYSLLATTEQLLGLPRLRSAASATTMTAAFGL